MYTLIVLTTDDYRRTPTADWVEIHKEQHVTFAGAMLGAQDYLGYAHTTYYDSVETEWDFYYSNYSLGTQVVEIAIYDETGRIPFHVYLEPPK